MPEGMWQNGLFGCFSDLGTCERQQLFLSFSVNLPSDHFFGLVVVRGGVEV